MLSNKFSAIDTLLAIGLILQINSDSKELSLSLLLIWSIIRLLQVARHHQRNEASRQLNITYVLLASLLIIQARTIVKVDDEHGITIFLLISIGAIIGSNLNLDAWTKLLNWMSVVIAVLSIPLLSFYEPKHEWMASSYRSFFNEGFGNINRLAIVVSLLTIASWYAFRQSQRGSFKMVLLIFTLLGYFTCLGTDSRMAAISPPIGALGGWAITHRHSLLRMKQPYKNIAFLFFLISPLAIIWHFAIRKDWSHGLSGDNTRLQLIRCWMNAIFTGHNRFLYGFGHQKQKIMEICSDAKIGNLSAHAPGSAGHAHNTYAHLVGLHGMLGLTFIILIGILAISNIRKLQQNIGPINIDCCPWAECCTGLFITLFINSICTTIHAYNHAIQILIGLILGAIFSNQQNLKPAPQQNIKLPSN